MPAFRVAISAPGSMQNLVLACIDQPEPRAGEVVIEVRAVGLNFRDVMAAMGCSRRMRKRSRPGGVGFDARHRFGGAGEGVDRGWIGRAPWSR